MKQFVVMLLLLGSVLLANDALNISKQAEQLLQEHQFKKAAQFLSQYQNHPDGLYYLSVVKLLTGELDDAIELAEKGLKIAQDKDRFYEWLGDLYSVKAQTSNMFSAMMTVSKIKKNWQKAIEINPNNSSAREKLFMFYLMAPGIAGGDEDKARQILDEVKTSDKLLSLLLEARWQQKEKNYKKARALFKQAVQLAPDSISVLYEAAQFYLRQSQLSEARKLAEKIITAKPERFTGYDLLGDIFTQKDQLDSALAQYDLALQKDPYQYKIEFKKAKILAKMGQKQQAKAIAQKLLSSEIFFLLKRQVEAFLKDL